MHRRLKELLTTARGQSEFVVVIFLDVRGFSSFAKLAESSESALFLKSAYLRILNDYFPDAAFFKPTGDGLLIIRGYNEETLAAVVDSSVSTSLRLVADFGQICSGDSMVNFEVPGELGIGLARGAATALRTDKETLDYSGRPLNLAARLMDLARPAGVVFDKSLGVELLDPETAAAFDEQDVYVKGIAEEESVSVYVLRGVTTIPPFNLRPMASLPNHVQELKPVSFQAVCARTIYAHQLDYDPADDNSVHVYFHTPATNAAGTRLPDTERVFQYKATVMRKAGEIAARVDYGPIIKQLKQDGIKGTWSVRIVIEYPIREPPPADAVTTESSSSA